MASRSRKLIRHFKLKVNVSSILAFVAGIVNSAALLGFGQFVSHVSGHASFAAVEYSDGTLLLALTSAFSLIVFIAGACFSAILLKGKTIEDPRISYAWPLFIEMLCISYVLLDTVFVPHTHKLSNSTKYENYFFLILSFAMGIQNATLRKTQGFFVRTTHITGTATDIGVAIGAIIAWGFREIKKYNKQILKWKNGQDLLETYNLIANSIKAVYLQSQAEKLFIHVSTITAFVIGAVCGTYGFLICEFKVLALPVGILLIIVLKEFTIRNKKWKNKKKIPNISNG